MTTCVHLIVGLLYKLVIYARQPIKLWRYSKLCGDTSTDCGVNIRGHLRLASATRLASSIAQQ